MHSSKPSPRVLEREETYAPLKLPLHQTYEPLDKEAYVSSLSTVKSKIGSFRKPT